MIKRTFFLLSAVYTSCIFILPGLISQRGMEQIWNPYSLLHIPLYGILMGLLTFAFHPKLVDSKAFFYNPSSLLLPGGIASLVGILDEISQAFIPYRDASIMDVFLDVGGIVLMALSISYWQKRRKSNRSQEKGH